MKAKLLKILTVFLITLAVLYPGMVVFSVAWVKHIEFVKTQKLGLELNKINPVSPTQNLEKSQVSKQFSDRNIVNQLLTAEHYKLALFLQWFFLLIPVFIGLSIIIYDRYLVYRAAVLREQIEMLERLWQQSIEQ